MKFEQHLADWQAAGLIDAATADRIRAHEAGRPHAGGGITIAEVVAYVGAIVVLVGVAFFIGVEYGPLGAWGRIAIVAMVGVAAAAAGVLMERRAETGAGRRARAAAYFLLVPVLYYLVLEGAHDFYPYEFDPQRTGEVFFIAGVLSALLAVPLLFRTRAWPLAIALVGSSYDAAGGAVSWGNLYGGPAELSWLAAGILLAGAAELLRRRGAQLGPEILRFAGLVAPVVAALVLSQDFAGSAQWLEPAAFVLAVAGFAPALLRGSTGYAIAAGLGLFICVNEVGFRHFASQVGFPVVLMISGVTLLAVAGGLLRLLPALRRREAPAG